MVCSSTSSPCNDLPIDWEFPQRPLPINNRPSSEYWGRGTKTRPLSLLSPPSLSPLTGLDTYAAEYEVKPGWKNLAFLLPPPPHGLSLTTLYANAPLHYYWYPLFVVCNLKAAPHKLCMMFQLFVVMVLVRQVRCFFCHEML